MKDFCIFLVGAVTALLLESLGVGLWSHWTDGGNEFLTGICILAISLMFISGLD